MMLRSTLALTALLILSGAHAHATVQDKSSGKRPWPPLAGDGKVFVREGEPLFIIDERRLNKSSAVDNPLDVERCRKPETCQIYVSDFFSEWSGRYGIEKSVLRSDVLMHQYPRVSVDGHSFVTGTYVFFLPKRDVFYLWGDCAMNHADMVLGPYAGDPRVVLKRLAEKTPVK